MCFDRLKEKQAIVVGDEIICEGSKQLMESLSKKDIQNRFDAMIQSELHNIGLFIDEKKFPFQRVSLASTRKKPPVDRFSYPH